MQVERIDRATGEVAAVWTGDHFAHWLTQREGAIMAQDIFHDVVLGGNYATAGYLYRKLTGPLPDHLDGRSYATSTLLD